MEGRPKVLRAGKVVGCDGVGQNILSSLKALNISV